MRHLSLPLIVCALLLSACDMNKPKVEPRTSYTQESTPQAMTAPCPNAAVVAPVKTNLHRKVTTVSDLGPMVQEEELSDGAIVPEEIIIQAEEERIYPSEDDRRTYNERQISPSEDSYPLDKSDRGQTYNETQISH